MFKTCKKRRFEALILNFDLTKFNVFAVLMNQYCYDKPNNKNDGDIGFPSSN